MSDSKFLAKIASDLDKPRGFAVLSRDEAPAYLADKPISLLWGVGAALQRRLAGDGIALVGQLAALGERELAARYGRIGTRLARLAQGVDDRAVLAHVPARSISAETTLARDEADAQALAHALWPLCNRVSANLKAASLAAGSVTLKLKTGDFHLRTRSRRLADPTQLAETLFRIASGLLAVEADGVTRYRLIGVGADLLVDGSKADLPTLFDQELGRPRRLEQAIDEIRGRLGDGSVRRGRDLARLGVGPAAEICAAYCSQGLGAAPKGLGSALRLAQRLNVVELGADRIIAVIDHHVARDTIVEKAHPELVIRLLGMGIDRKEGEPDVPALAALAAGSALPRRGRR